MKRAFLVAIVLLVTISLFACDVLLPVPPAETTPPTDAPAVTLEPVPEETVSPSPEPSDVPFSTPENAASELDALLTDLLQNYHPGTAGCSLTAARLAGTLLDWYAAAQPDAAAITAATQEFYGTLDVTQAVDFAEQLGGVYSVAQELLSDTAADFLESAGYAPTAFPWTEAAVTDLFTALYSGLGLALPE